MKSRLALLCGMLAALAGSAAHGQVRVFIAQDGAEASAPASGNTTIALNPGQSADVSIWVDDDAPGDLLNFYQVIIRWQAMPQAGAMGLVDYVNGAAPGNSVFVDAARPDFVFAGNGIGPVFYNETPPGPPASGFGAIVNLQSLAAGVQVSGIRYLGEFTVRASADACGQHVMAIVQAGAAPAGGTSFGGPGGLIPYPVNLGMFTLQDLTIDVGSCAACTDPCDDGDPCTISDQCEGDLCAGTPVDCSNSGDACNTASCDPAGSEGNCDVLTPLANGTSCDDADPCTVGDSCQAGACQSGTAPDCSGDGDACNTASCDPAGTAGNCDVLTPAADGTACDDADGCTVGDSCQAGVCQSGMAPDCSGDGDACNTASCDPAGTAGNCDVLTPVADGTACDDADGCTVGDTCQAGSCQSGMAPDCSAAGDDCNDASCDSGGPAGNCDVLTPANDDQPCDGGGGVCNAGTCEPVAGVTTRLFMAADGAQASQPVVGNTSVTVAPSSTTRIAIWLEDAVQMDELNFYQALVRWEATPDAGVVGLVQYVNDGLPNGGSVVVDSARPDFVLAGAAIAPVFYNETPPPPPTSAGFGALVNLQNLNAGVTVTGIRYVAEFDISATADACGTHVLSFVPENGMPQGGTSFGGPGGLSPYIIDSLQSLTVMVACDGCTDPCSDGDDCTVNDQCVGDACMGEPLDCGDGDLCTEDLCMGGVCSNPPVECTRRGTVCDPASGLCVECLTADDCGDGNACTVDLCSAGVCVNDPAADGTACDDADACTVGDTCQSGACQAGMAPDCSAAGNDCNDASCDPAGPAGNCDVLTPVADGVVCDDADPCTVGDTCQAGSCQSGMAPDCSAAGDDCNDASCDSGGPAGNCDVLTPANDDQPCDGGGGVCNAGNCEPVAGVTTRLFMAADGTQASQPVVGNTSVTVAPASTTRIVMWLEDAVQLDQLNFYQALVRWEATPDAGVVGLVQYVNDGLPNGGSVVVDSARPDFVLAGAAIAPVFYNETPPPPPTSAGFGALVNLQNLNAGVTVTGIRYVAEFDISATADACGAHVLSFVPENGMPQGGTSFGGPGGLSPYVIDRIQSLTVIVNCDVCTDPCDDGDPCTINDQCDGDQCVGEAVDCSGDGDACNTASCDPSGAEGNCDVLTPVANGTACDDADACTVGDSCQAGACQSGMAPDCSGDGDACNTASCDPAGTEGNCDVLTPLANGTVCDDADPCTVGDTCQAGACQSGMAPDCSAAGDDCNDASCDSGGPAGNCDVLTPANDGQPCDGGTGVCTGGTCEPVGGVTTRLFMAADGAQASQPVVGNTTVTVAPASTTRIAIWLEDAVQMDELNFYQALVRWEATPGAGVVGLVQYVNDGLPNGGSVVVNSARPDFVLAGAAIAPVFYNETPPPPPTSAGFGALVNLQNLNAGVTVTGIRYVAEFDISATADACGTHVLSFVPENGMPQGGTSFGGPGGLSPYVIDRIQSLTVIVNCDACTDPCDDGNVCTVDDQCDGDVCVGEPIDCSMAGDDCNVAMCDAGGAVANCDVLVPANDGLPCSDGAGVCSGGVCEIGECPQGAVNWIDPPTGVIDARQPHPVDSLEPMQGIRELLVAAPAGATLDCWSLCETADGGFGPNGIESVTDHGDGTYTIVLVRVITPGAVTTVTLGNASCQAGVFTSHPGNVNGDDESNPMDILFLIDILNGAVEAPFGAYSADLNHRGLVSPLDILVLIDLLNGADFHDPWNGTPLPVNTCDQCLACTTDTDCDDSNPCTTETCNPLRGGCDYVVVVGACDDGDACTSGDACEAGMCVGDVVDCDDDNPCTADACNPVQGCLNTPAKGPCDDGDSCTEGDACVAGSCMGQPLDCDDGSTCTVDSCDGGTCSNTDILVLNIACTDGPQGDAFCAGLGAPSAVCENGVCACSVGNNLNPTDTLCLTLRGASSANQMGTCVSEADCGPAPDGVLQCVDDDFDPLNGGICVDQACYAPGGTVVVDVELGRTAEPACGAQLFLEWDLARLDLVMLELDPDGEFGWTQVFFQNVNDVAGTIDIALATPIGTACNAVNGTLAGGTVARLTFNALGSCKSFGVRFRPHNPVSGVGGPNGQIPLAGCHGAALPSATGDLNIDAAPPVWTCPTSSSGPADPGGTTRMVTFPPVAVTDSCDPLGDVLDLCTVEYFPACETPLDCDRGPLCASGAQCPSGVCLASPKAAGFLCGGQPCSGFCQVDECIDGLCTQPVDPMGIDLDAYLGGGGAFLHGLTEIRCGASNACGLSSGCSADILNTGP